MESLDEALLDDEASDIVQAILSPKIQVSKSVQHPSHCNQEARHGRCFRHPRRLFPQRMSAAFIRKPPCVPATTILATNIALTMLEKTTAELR